MATPGPAPYTDVFPRVSVLETHWVDLFVDFMLKNKPCILCASATEDWESRKKWVANSETGKGIPNFDHFSQTYGNLMVPLVDEEKCEQSCLSLSEYVSYAKECGSRNGFKYLKDWHFQKESGTSYATYTLPSFLQFDWINNEAWSDKANPFGDYRFVYFGVKNTWTILHSDVMSSYSWSANICGNKLWYFVPLQNEELFRQDRFSFVKDIQNLKEKWKDAHVISFVQQPGEIVFVPSNWYHQVHNLDDAISINHNFFNASNIDLAFRLICDRLVDVRQEIADVRDVFTKSEFEEQCQTILQADIRINFQMLLDLMALVIEDRKHKAQECWVCPKHQNIFKCKQDDSCMEYIKKKVKDSCTCTSLMTLCQNCTRFMHMYELSCAIQICHMIESYKMNAMK